MASPIKTRACLLSTSLFLKNGFKHDCIRVSPTVNNPTRIFSMNIIIVTASKYNSTYIDLYIIRSRCKQIFRPTIYRFPFFGVILICIEVLIKNFSTKYNL